MQQFQLTLLVLALASVSTAQQLSHTDKPFTATISDTFVKKLAGGNVVTHTATGSFYRDQDGRIRIERDGQISIQDPVAGFNAVLDPATRTARKLVTVPRASIPVSGSISSGVPPPGGSAGGAAPPPTNASSSERPAPVELGKQTISGYVSSGKRFTTTIPVGAVGNILPIVTTTEVWTADQLHFAVMVKTSNVLNGDHTTQYDGINIANTSLDPALFAIPPDYQVTTTNMKLNSPFPRGVQHPGSK